MNSLVSLLDIVFLVAIEHSKCLHHCLTVGIGLGLLSLLPFERQCLRDLTEVREGAGRTHFSDHYSCLGRAIL